MAAGIPSHSDDFDAKVRPALRRMIVEVGCEDAVAEAIRRFEGWTSSIASSRVRIMQALSDYNRRKFDANWLPIVVRIVTYHGGEDQVSALIAEARYQGRRARDELEAMARDRKPAIRKVPAREKGRAAG